MHPVHRHILYAIVTSCFTFLPLAGGVLSGPGPLKTAAGCFQCNYGILQELVRKKEQSNTGKRIQDHSKTCLLLQDYQ